MKAVLLLSIIPFFFLLLLIPAHAYISVDKNISTPTSEGLACTNVSGTFYCYLFVVNYPAVGDRAVVRYNATLEDSKWCEFNYHSTAYVGSGIVNATHLIYVSSTPATSYLIDISSIATNTTCQDTLITSPTVGSGVNRAGFSYSDNSSGFNYWGASGAISNSTTSSTISAIWTDVTANNLHMISLPNQTTNVTAYATNHSVGTPYTDFNYTYIFKLTSGVIATTYNNPFITYGIPTANSPYNIDFHKENASTTWLYMSHNSRAYRMNWTEAEDLGGGVSIRYVAGIGNGGITTTESIIEVGIGLTSSCNGTLIWYYDGSIKGNTSITTAPMSTEEYYYYALGVLSTGSHTWYASFLDSCTSTYWNTSIQKFTVQTAQGSYDYILQNPANGMALLVGGVFSIYDLESSKHISSIIFTFVIAIAIVLGIGMVGKGKMASDSLLSIFGISIMVLLSMFTLMGWFPSWLLIILLVISAYAFVKMGKIGG